MLHIAGIRDHFSLVSAARLSSSSLAFASARCFAKELLLPDRALHGKIPREKTDAACRSSGLVIFAIHFGTAMIGTSLLDLCYVYSSARRTSDRRGSFKSVDAGMEREAEKRSHGILLQCLEEPRLGVMRPLLSSSRLRLDLRPDVTTWQKSASPWWQRWNVNVNVTRVQYARHTQSLIRYASRRNRQ